MKILYGVQTTGRGHVVRSRIMIDALRNLGHAVSSILSGPNLPQGWQVEIFKPYVAKKGLTFATRNGSLQYIKTVRELHLLQYFRDVLSHRPVDYDLVITDYEPISARIARYRGIPSIGIGHLYAFYHRVPIPRWNPFRQWVMRSYAPVKISLGMHWHHFDQPLLPPSIAPDVRPSNAPLENKILIYLPFENLQDIKNLVARFGEFEFYVYASMHAPQDDRNLHLRPLSRKGFLEDLAECKGVICGAGFSLISEALHLGKTILVKPIAGQLEQEANALALKQLNLGMVMKKLRPGVVAEWLKLKMPDPMNYPDIIPTLAAWISRGNWNDLNELVRDVWRAVPAPTGDS